MTVTKKIIGRIPICFGTWYAKQGGWGIKNRVTLYGSEFESLHENNTVPPAVYDDINHTVTFNESDWRVISNGTEAWIADTKINDLGTWIDSPEFIRVYLDSDEKFLFGIRKDASVEWAKGVPTPIRNEINKILSKIDETLTQKVADIEETLQQMSELYGIVIDSPEWIRLYTDDDNHILLGIRADGSVEWGKGIPTPVRKAINALYKYIDIAIAESEEKMDYFKIITSPEYIFAIVDAEDKFMFGVKTNGNIEWAKGIPTPIRNEFETFYARLETLDSSIVQLNEFEDRIEAIINVESNPEIIEATLDGEQRLLGYRDKNGVRHEQYFAVEKSLSLSEDAMTGFQQALKDSGFSPDNSKKYNAPYLPSYGTINVKTETFYLTAHPNVNSINDVELRFDFADTYANAADRMTIAHYYIKNTNIRLQHYASGKVTLNTEDNKYYAKDPIRKVNGVCYYADSLGFQSTSPSIGSPRTKVISGYTRTAPDVPELSEGGVVQSLVEVVEITGPCCVNAWTIEDWSYKASEGADIGKKYEHKCIADINFSNYLNKQNIAVTLKSQGNSTMGLRKRNYRITFYKNNTYSKKDKIRIGEMFRLSKYNLKANYNDNSRIKENILYRIFIDIWNNRPITDRYNWDNTINGLYHGATGNIQGFPMRLDVGGNFYGIYNFDLPKDGNNYFIDDKDEDTGLLLCGSGGHTDNDWGVTLPYSISGHYASEMDSDDLNDYPEIIASLEEWHHFINNRLYKGSDDNLYNSTELTEVEGTMYVTATLEDGQVVPTSVSASLIKFNKENIPYRLDVLGFIDYFICLQVFLMDDNLHHNIMFYSDGEKKKIFPFFYDLDNAIRMTKGVDFDLFNTSTDPGKDLSFWNNFKDIYWDNIVNRYSELRKTILSIEYITSIYKSISSGIEASDYISESQKWGGYISASNFEIQLAFLSDRINYLDNNYFNI